MELEKFLYLKTIETEDLELPDILKPHTSNYQNASIIAAYVIYIARNAGYGKLPAIEKFIQKEIKDESLAHFIKHVLSSAWEDLSSVLYKYDMQTLEAYILFGGYGKTDWDFETPESLIELALKILNIKPEDTVADYGTGRASFTVSAYLNEPRAFYYANEIATEVKVIAFVRAQLLGNNTQIVQEDMFEMDKDKKFDKIFSNYPFGMRLRDLRGGISFLERNKETFPQIEKATSSDWFFNALLISSLKQGGKAIGIMTNGSTWNSIDRPVREYFIRKGYIECVIALPERIFNYTTIPTAMIVFSHGNKQVKLVDATEMYQKGRRMNTIRKTDIEAIYGSYVEDTNKSKTVDLEELENNDFVINPIRYITNEIEIENGVPLESLVKSITRGAPCTAAQLDIMVSKKPTNIQYMMLANIKDGLIDEELPYLSEIESRYEKYCVKNNNLLLSKNGYPFKVAIAQMKDNQKILANGNLYIIELDEDKVEPYYIKAFLESEQGIASLKRIAVGAAIPNIALEPLKKLMIPMVSMERQKEIAQSYLATLDEIAILKLKIKKATNSLRNIFAIDGEEE